MRHWQARFGIALSLLLAACGGTPVSPTGAPVGGSSSTSSSAAPSTSAATTSAARASSSASASSASSSAAATTSAATGAAATGSAPSPNDPDDRQGVTDTEVVIGVWSPQTGPAAPAYSTNARAQDAYFKMINEQGGVNGRKIRFVIQDDQYQPSLTLAAVKKLVEQDKVFAINGGLGTPTGLAVLPYLLEKKVPHIYPLTGSSVWSKPLKPTYFAVQPNYTIEGQVEANYALKEFKPKRIGIFYQNDAFGKEGAESFVATIKKAGIEPVVQVTYEPSDTEFSSAALKFQDAKCDLVYLFSIPKPTALLLKESEKLGFKPKWLGSYVIALPVMFDLAGKSAMEGITFGQWLPDPEANANEPYMKQMIETLKKYDPKDQPGDAQGGWTAAQVMVEGLKRTGRDLSRSNLVKAMETFKNWSSGNIPPFSYSATDHQGVKSLYFVRAENGKFVKISDYVTAE